MLLVDLLKTYISVASDLLVVGDSSEDVIVEVVLPVESHEVFLQYNENL